VKINLQKEQNLYVTSDLHLNHKNICSGTTCWDIRKERTRNFDSLEDMNQVILNNINSKVGLNDVLFLLGDVFFGTPQQGKELLGEINCQNIHLIVGNHDHYILMNKENLRERFASVQDYLYLTVTSSNNEIRGKHRFVLMHYPIVSWNNMARGVIHLHGHVHLPPQQKVHEGKSMDVGMDGNNLEVYSLQEINEIMKDQPIMINQGNPDLDYHNKISTNG
jgi:calcineurin-like phosphoesterase family protein